MAIGNRYVLNTQTGPILAFCVYKIPVQHRTIAKICHEQDNEETQRHFQLDMHYAKIISLGTLRYQSHEYTVMHSPPKTQHTLQARSHHPKAPLFSQHISTSLHRIPQGTYPSMHTPHVLPYTPPPPTNLRAQSPKIPTQNSSTSCKPTRT